MLNNSRDLIKSLKETSFIKVPFVGEFNASKSSLLNAYIGNTLLPTDITPETAVSYELYYSVNEILEVWHYDTLKETAPLSKIHELKVVPGDIVKVYINNDKIRLLNQRGIVLVDMPGIDSGLEEHNNAILNYIQEGTFYVIVSDIQHGTLTSSSLLFIQELKKYSISSAVLISKIDRKPEEEVSKVLASIKDLSHRLIGPNTFVGAVSALSNQISDMENLLSTMNGEDFAKKKFIAEVTDFINRQIVQLELQANLLNSPSDSVDDQIRKLEAKREEIVNRINNSDANAQPIEDSVQDILNDIRTTLSDNSYQLASTLFSHNDAKELNSQVLSLVRPVLVNSFKREIGEYQEVIGKQLEEVANDIEEILKGGDNTFAKETERIIGTLIDKEVLESLMSKGLQILLNRFAAYKSLTILLGTIGKVLTPLVGILLSVLPDILHFLFGKGKEKKIAEIQEKIETTVIGKITDAMHTPIYEILAKQRAESLENMKKIVEQELDSIDASLAEAKARKEADEANKATMINNIKEGIKEIIAVRESL